jgi:AcrR family transcriptional regulator
MVYAVDAVKGSEAAEGGVADAGLLKRIRNSKQRVRKRAPGRPTADQSGQLRDGVINAALHVFLERGFEAASLEAIARDAKVAKITIYRQFGSKEKLFREVAHYAQGVIQRRVQANVETSGTPEAVLRSTIAGLQESFTDPDYLAVLRLVVAEAPRFPEIARTMLSETDFALGPLIGYLQRLKDEGVLGVENPRDAAIQLTAVAIGGVRYLMQKPSADPKARAHWVDSVYRLFARAWGLMPLYESGGKGRKA